MGEVQTRVLMSTDDAAAWRRLDRAARKARSAVPLAPAAECFTVGVGDQIGELAPAGMAHPEVETRRPRAVTVYAVALIFQPRAGSNVAPLVILRQLVRTGDKPISDKDAITQAVHVEIGQWKETRPALGEFTAPTGIVSYRVIPAFA